MLYVKLTELEKAILLAVLLMSKGSTPKLLPERKILEKFSPRQRKNAMRYIKKLVNHGLLVKCDRSYRLTPAGQKQARGLLFAGVRLLKKKFNSEFLLEPS